MQITLVLLAAGLILMLGGTFLGCTHPEKVQLYNSNSGVRLQRTTLWGLELRYKWVTSGKPLPIDLELSQPLAYPPSITVLPTELYISMEQAVAILRTALIGLLAKGHIQVYHFQSHEFKRWIVLPSVQDVYLIVATREFDQARLKGKLEREIRRVLANWSKRKEAKEWPDGPPIYDLVRAIYQSDKKSPQGWLAQLVAKDATAQGWGQIIKGILRKRFELDAAHANQLQQEEEIMKALSKRLAQSHPNFSLALDKQVERGIKSREERDVDVDID
jgi:hypothetical protein